MQDLIDDFERQCGDAGVSPVTVLVAAGIGRWQWPRWKGGKFSPTLRNFEAAKAALRKIEAEKSEQSAAAEPEQGAAA